MLGYTGFDHGAWAERHMGTTLTPFGLRVFDILGMAYRGIYNAPIAWKSIYLSGAQDWETVQVSVRGDDLSTFDSNKLTDLVFLCHEARIRFSVNPCGPCYFRLSFFPRKDTGGLSQRHPNLDEAVASFHAALPPDHRIIYRATEPAQEVA